MSAAEKKHDYHLVDPSPWPIFCSFAQFNSMHWSGLLFHNQKPLVNDYWIGSAFVWSLYVVSEK